MNHPLARCSATTFLTLLAVPFFNTDCIAQNPVALSATVTPASITAGKDATIEIVADVTKTPDAKGKRWHIYPRKGVHRGVEVPTSISIASEEESIKAGKVKWPRPRMTQNAMRQLQPVYEGKTVFKVPLETADTLKPGTYKIQIDFRYQTCASLCLAPKTEKLFVDLVVTEAKSTSDGSTRAETDDSTKITTSDETEVTSTEALEEPESDASSDKSTENSDVEKSDEMVALPDSEKDVATLSEPPKSDSSERGPPKKTNTPRPSNSPAIQDDAFKGNVFGYQFGFSAENSLTKPLVILFAFIGGFLLNLTPCVLPIIPIKIMGLTKVGGAKSRILSVIMGFGILAFWLAIGAAICFVSGFDSISALFQRPAFGILVGLFIAIMGIGMIVDLAIQLPQTIYRFNPSQDTYHGAFLFGIMTAVLSTPCTAPFMGSAAAWATKANNPALVLSVFAAIAAGMGWPYVALAWFPRYVSWIPKTGPASVLVKQVMGLLMLAVAVFFSGTGILGLIKSYPHLGPVLHWWIATGIVAAMGCWLTIRTIKITSSTPRRAAAAVGALALFGAMAVWARSETLDSVRAIELKKRQTTQLAAYVKQLEEALHSGEGIEGGITLRAPAWRDYDAAAAVAAKRKGQVSIVHFTADW